MAGPFPALEPLEIGVGRVHLNESIQLEMEPTASGYANAQVDDHHSLPRSRFPWSPPLRLSLEARASRNQPLGTLGFGFWNDPFSFGQAGAGRYLPAPPNALWFFYGSEPNDLALARGAPGHGWKASSLRSPAIHPAILALPAAFGFALSFVPGLRPLIINTALRAITASERGLELALSSWHHYQLEWTEASARFTVDEQTVLISHDPPTGPLGFIAWIDNQYAQVSPQHGLRFGVIPTHRPQSLEIRNLTITAID